MRKTAATEIKAPGKYEGIDKPSVFLGGAIDQGKSVDWQERVAKALDDLDILILNPRRDDWDSTWKQTADDPQFSEQVRWEIEAQEKCDLLLYVYTKDSKAPVTMFENGAWGTKKACMVCVEEGFYRQGNLDIYMGHFNIPIYHDLDEMIADLHETLEDKL